MARVTLVNSEHAFIGMHEHAYVAQLTSGLSPGMACPGHPQQLACHFQVRGAECPQPV